MSPDQLVRLTQKLALYAAYYKTQLPDAVLKMYAADLSDLDFIDCDKAMEMYRKNPKNRVMPIPAQIRDIACPVVDTDSAGREIAARIQESITRFGSWQGDLAKAFIGDVGWSIVQSYGGWSRVCEEHGVSLDKGQFMAQARDLAKGRLTHTPIALALAIGARNEVQSLESAKSILKLITNPEGT